MILAGCALLASCDYTVPLVDKPSLEIDHQMVGLWARTKADHQTERLLVLPLDAKEYMVAYPQNASDSAMFARACLVECAGRKLVQLTWIGNAAGNLPDDDRVYQVSAYSIKGDELTVNLLNTDVVDKDIKTSAELADAIAQNKSHPELFVEPLIFTKVKD
ncbi:MAG TPA: hypothetical protein DCZ95_18890 [Verrucomicrobia bacterium]|nr:hypothetical protein [Verrucomicrobiota bacterium]